jgi:hypothetical protein
MTPETKDKIRKMAIDNFPYDFGGLIDSPIAMEKLKSNIDCIRAAYILGAEDYEKMQEENEQAPMKTAGEILNKYHSSDNIYPTGLIHKGSALAAMNEYANQFKSQSIQHEAMRTALEQISKAGLAPKFIVDIARKALNESSTKGVTK